jgi:hypothetical protein
MVAFLDQVLPTAVSDSLWLVPRTPGPPIGITPCLVQGVTLDARFMTFIRAVHSGHPEAVQSYVRVEWFDEDAVAWANLGVHCDDATDWIALGVEPHEAAPLVARGLTAPEAVREWAAVGIGTDEAGQWIGAGLEPAEAAAQRARGIGAEHAAVLRSLRTA